MTNEHDTSVSANPLDRDLYTSSQTRERVLNSAVVQADITEIFDAFYADDIEVTSEGREEPIRGKARVALTSR